MHLTQMVVQNFRNYKQASVEPDSGLNLLVGNNAQGKTNFLEGIFFLATVRSLRAQRESDLVQWGADRACLRAGLLRASGEIELRVDLFRDRPKQARVQGQRVHRMTDFLGSLHAVAFTPDDLQLVKGAPGQRRRYLDVQLCQLSQGYRRRLVSYQKVLAHRNHLLRGRGGWAIDQDALAAWDAQLVDLGSWLMNQRAAAIRRLTVLARHVHAAITGEKEDLEMGYLPFFRRDGRVDAGQDRSEPSFRDGFLAALESLRREEIRRGVSLVGPQRDDLSLTVNGREARTFASQGQQRTVVLACKLAELQWMREEAGEFPVLLLDDVLSELDAERREYLLTAVTGKVQTFLTTTGVQGLSASMVREAGHFHIEAGRIQRVPAAGEA